MAQPGKAIPEGFNTITPHMVVKDAATAIDFYKKAFAAEEVFCMPGPGGQGIMHAELKIGNSMLMMCEERPGDTGCQSPASLKGTPITLHLYVEDVDKSFQRAIDAGAKCTMEVMDTFWGDRYGKVRDPFGYEWSLATHKLDLTPDEIAKGAEEFFKNMGACGH